MKNEYYNIFDDMDEMIAVPDISERREIAPNFRVSGMQAMIEKQREINEANANLEAGPEMKGEYRMIDLSERALPFKPYNYQIEDIKTMLAAKKIINACDMGCGKTFESVVTGESIPAKKLVICPASLRKNWVREINNVNRTTKVEIIYNDKKPVIGEDWTVIGYPSLSKYESFLLDQNFQVIFIDEAHYIKSINNSGKPSSQRASVVLKLAEKAEYVYPITGTPKTNRNKDLYNILRVINHPLTRPPRNYFKYAMRYCNGYQDMYGWHFEGNSYDDELYKYINKYMIRHLKREVLPDLKKQRIAIPVEVSLQKYKAKMDDYKAKASATDDPEAIEVLAAMQKAKQALAIAKIEQTINFADTILDLADSAEERESIVIVTCFREVIDRIYDKYGNDCVKVEGGMSDSAKQAAVDDFQAGRKHIMVMQIIAGGVGITLTRAHIMIFNDYDWVVGNVTQAEDRICRSGQTEPCIIYFMHAEGAELDDIMQNVLSRKSETLNAAVDGGTGTTVSYRSAKL